ncbi:L-threonylcarbamoyladenylate synthase [Sphingomonas sp. 32-62-10]|uniref:L-threonylcarbamoyladenylate synthase n=1 Tax=Sphingomonas sp. 32-62-10 TaxID=1970436 RepID=UPI000BD9AB39|nr:MAG: threonylcarbamoyl-AMP synthase [Sphingomonas sp. 32-62-10]
MITPNTAFETQTFPYGDAAIAEGARLIAACVAADAANAAAVAAIYAAKGRPSFNPLIVHVLDLAAAEAIAVVDDRARALAAAFWPGPLTLVLPMRPDSGIASLVTAGLDTIAIRVPAHRAMRALLAATRKPLAAPSANASGAISPTRAAHVMASLNGRIAMIIDDGPTSAGLESTIIMPGDPPRLLRPGPIPAEVIEAVIGAALAAAPGGIIAPGQLASHYAPAKPLRINANIARAGEWMIGFGDLPGDETLSETGDLIEAAARLFDCLHRADASDCVGIAVARIPIDGIGVAINDRLIRAAHR